MRTLKVIECGDVEEAQAFLKRVAESQIPEPAPLILDCPSTLSYEEMVKEWEERNEERLIEIESKLVVGVACYRFYVFFYYEGNEEEGR